MNKQSNRLGMIALFTGIVIGAIVGFFYEPDAWKKTGDQIQGKAGTIKDKVADSLEQIKK